MISLKTNYDNKTDNCQVVYSSKDSNTYEHLTAIRTLVDKILENDAFGLGLDGIIEVIKKSSYNRTFELISKKEKITKKGMK